MPFVRRNKDGEIFAKYTVPQAGEKLEWIEEGSKELLPSIDALRSKKWEEIKTARTAAISVGISFNGQDFQSDPDSIANIAGAVSGVMTAESLGIEVAPIQWTLTSNDTIKLEPKEMKMLGLVAMEHVQNQYARGVALRVRINKARTKDELDAIIW